MKLFLLLSALFLATACTGIPDGIKPIKDFDLIKYQGTWYEIARLDHSFERGLEQVSAQYSIQESGDVRVINRGFSSKDNEWSEAIGQAKFVENTDEGYLKVSFFGPFYGSYVIFYLDENYQHAFVSGPNTSYLWFLSRTKTVEPALMENFMPQAAQYSFNTDEIIIVDQK
jgi:apolipoprotein D and lipocalin family protein